MRTQATHIPEDITIKEDVGMRLPCQVELRRVDPSSESLAEETADLTMPLETFYRLRGSRDGP